MWVVYHFKGWKLGLGISEFQKELGWSSDPNVWGGVCFRRPPSPPLQLELLSSSTTL